MQKLFFRLSSWIREEHLIALAIGLVTLVLFWPAAQFDFIHFDDFRYAPENPMVFHGLTASGIYQAFTTVHEQWWLPALWISYAADVSAFGSGPQGHHLTNIVLHVLNAVLLFWVLFRMTGSRWRSAFVAAVFAWHPTRVEAVAWIAARKDVLSGLFFMLALWAYSGFVQKPSSKRMFGIFLLMLLGLMSKAIVVVLPAILLVLDFWPLHRAQRIWGREAWKEWKPLLFEKIPILLLAVFFMGLNLSTHTTGRGDGAGFPIWARLALIFPNVLDYLRVSVFPIRLSIMYPENDVVSWPLTIASLLGLLAVTGICLWQREKRPYWLVGWCWFLLGLVPILRGLRLGLAKYADRWTYLPIIGLAMMFAWTLASIGQKPWLRKGAWLVFGLILVVCLNRTHAQLPWWRNSLMVFSRAVFVNPTSAFAHNGLGMALAEDGQKEEGIVHIQQAIRLKPIEDGYVANLASVLLELDRAAEAIELADIVIHARPDADEYISIRGRALEALGRIPEAKIAFEETLRLNPKNQDANIRLGVYLFQEGKAAEALPYLQMAVSQRNDSAMFWYNLGMALAQLGRYAEAQPCVENALALEPGKKDAREALGRLRLMNGAF